MPFDFDRKRVFAESERLGFTSLALYGEDFFRRTLVFFENRFSSQINRGGGFQLEATSPITKIRATLSSASTESLLAILQCGRSHPAPLTGQTQDASLQSSSPTSDTRRRLQEVARKAFAKYPSVQQPVLRFEETKRRFFSDDGQESPQSGDDNWASFSARWFLKHGRALIPFEFEIARANEAALWKSLEQGTSFEEEISLSVTSLTRWPVPKGELPVYWSSKAISVLCQQFLKAFEADRVLGDDSFLNHCQLPLSLRFSIQENAPAEGAFDQEGSPRKALRIFSEGRPRALACRRAEAEALSVPTTGHARRLAFGESPRIGFWQPSLVPLQSRKGLLANLSHGLSIRDLSVAQYDTRSGQIALQVRGAHLVHQGKEGERTEDFVIETNLVDLLSGLEDFEEKAETQSLPLSAKGRGVPPIEISAPSALSPSVFIPGTVPLAQYW